MANDSLPAEVRQFLSRHISSVEQLEILLLVSGSPGRAWTVQDVYSVIRSSEGSVANRLEMFTQDGFLTADPGPPKTYTYAPASSALRDSVAKTAAVYQTLRVRVIEAIFQPEMNPAQGFADAFRFRKES